MKRWTFFFHRSTTPDTQHSTVNLLMTKKSTTFEYFWFPNQRIQPIYAWLTEQMNVLSSKMEGSIIIIIKKTNIYTENQFNLGWCILFFKLVYARRFATGQREFFSRFTFVWFGYIFFSFVGFRVFTLVFNYHNCLQSMDTCIYIIHIRADIWGMAWEIYSSPSIVRNQMIFIDFENFLWDYSSIIFHSNVRFYWL